MPGAVRHPRTSPADETAIESSGPAILMVDDSIATRALESAEQRARGLEFGADAYLPKSSFDQEQLLQTIRQLIAER